MDPLGNTLTTHQIQTGWDFTMEPYLSGQFGFVDDPDRQFGKGSVWTLTRTQRYGLEPLLTLLAGYGPARLKEYLEAVNLEGGAMAAQTLFID
jgi:hypothetical protein